MAVTRWLTGVDTAIPQLPGPRMAWLKWILYSVLAGWSCGAPRGLCGNDGNSSCLHGVPSLPTALLHAPPGLAGTFPREALPLESLALLLGTQVLCAWECVCLCVCVFVLCVYMHAGMLSGLGGGGELLTS